MGGINCGSSNNRTRTTSEYRLGYASYSKYLFKCLESFYSANALVEDFTLLELENTDDALIAYKGVLVALQQAITYLQSAGISLSKCYNEIEPLFKFSRLKNGSVEQYEKFDESFAKKLFEKEGIVTSETKVWNSVIQSLKQGGEVDYLLYQQEELKKLETILQNLLEEYRKLEKDIRQGVSYVSIRDIDIEITPLTAVALTKISELISSLTYLCLVEYSAHTSVSGKTVDVFDLVPKSSNNIMVRQMVN